MSTAIPVSEDQHTWIHEYIPRVSRTFALTIDLLDEPLSTHTAVGYLLCRIADTVEDESRLPMDERADLLRSFAISADPTVEPRPFLQDIEPWLTDAPDEACWSLVEETEQALDCYHALDEETQQEMWRPIEELILGMALFCDRHHDTAGLRISSLTELREYCHYVAGTVGELSTRLVTFPDDVATERLYEQAESFGQLLQLTNVSKDVYDDYESENSVYLPDEWLDEVDVDQNDLLTANNSTLAPIVRRLVDHALSHTDDAHAYLQTLRDSDSSAYRAYAVPYLLALATLREVRKTPKAVFTAESVKVSRAEVMDIVTAVVSDPTHSLDTLRSTHAPQ